MIHRTMLGAVLTIFSTSASFAQTANVSIFLVDTFGGGVGSSHVTRFVDRSGRNFADHFTDLEGRDIPLGDYLVQVKSDVLGFTTDRISVERDSVWIVLAGTTSFTDYAPGREPRLSGRVKNMQPSADGPVWIKLVGIYLNWTWTSRVATDGTFGFINIPSGAYMLLMIRPNGVVRHSEVYIKDPASLIEVDVSGQTTISIRPPVRR